jgi:predicted  nucleic acid-binding Zn-ribbon protein
MKDYKDLSFNQIVDLVGNLYKEIDRLTAERKASQEALEKLSSNVHIGDYSLSKIKQAVTDTINGYKIVPKPQPKAKRKK